MAHTATANVLTHPLQFSFSNVHCIFPRRHRWMANTGTAKVLTHPLLIILIFNCALLSPYDASR